MRIYTSRYYQIDEKCILHNRLDYEKIYGIIYKQAIALKCLDTPSLTQRYLVTPDWFRWQSKCFYSWCRRQGDSETKPAVSNPF